MKTDPRTLSAIIAFELHKCSPDARFLDFEQNPDETALKLVGLGPSDRDRLDPLISPEMAFSVAFELAIKLCAHVTASPLSPDANMIAEAIENARATVKDICSEERASRTMEIQKELALNPQ